MKNVIYGSHDQTNAQYHLKNMQKHKKHGNGGREEEQPTKLMSSTQYYGLNTCWRCLWVVMVPYRVSYIKHNVNQ